VLTPLYLHHIGPSLYGAWLALANLLSWASVLDPGVARITSQRVALHLGKNQREQMYRAFYDGLAVALVLGCAPLALLPLADYPAHFFQLPAAEQAQLSSACRWSLIGIFFVLVDGPFWALVRGLQRPLFLGAAQVGSGLVGILTAAYLLLVADVGIASLPLGAVARVLVEWFAKAVYLLYIPEGLRACRPSKPSWPQIWLGFKSYRAGFALVVGTLLRTQFTYFCAAKFVSPSSAAILAVSTQALLPLQQLIDRTIQAPMASFSHLVGARGTRAIGGVFDRLRDSCFFILFVGLAGTVALNETFVGLWVGPALFGGTALTCLLAIEMGQGLSMLVHQEALFAMGAIGEIGRVRLIEGLFKAAAQVLLCLLIGIIGIPLAGILSACFARLVLVAPLEVRYLGVQVHAARRGAWMELCRMLAAVGVGLLGYGVAHRALSGESWTAFVSAASFAAVLYAGCGWFLLPSVRKEFRGFSRAVVP
jgi:O-antigen/teichoic acid export membrane protein